MKLQDQVCSLELAKQLKGLGVEQDSYFYHVAYEEDGEEYSDIEEGYNHNSDYICYSAYTVAELGEMLPHHLEIEGVYCDLEIIKSIVWRFYYGKDKIIFTAFTGDTEADARARMLIYLKNNDLLTI